MGRVLLHLDYQEAWAKIRRACPPGDDASFEAGFRVMFHDPVTARYERGETDLDPIYQRMVDLTGYQGSQPDFVDIWCGIFRPNAPMIAFAGELADSYPVYLLSNSNAMHENYVRHHFPEAFAFLSGEAFSHHMHVLKPDPLFYEKALEQFGLHPETCLFVDDLAANVEGAKACGIRSVLYTEPEATIQHVRRALIEHN